MQQTNDETEVLAAERDIIQYNVILHKLQSQVKRKREELEIVTKDLMDVKQEARILRVANTENSAKFRQCIREALVTD